jgi:raffinose/stachyose/melibiose transport system substrate-binding protein
MKKTIFWLIIIVFILSLTLAGTGCKEEAAPFEEVTEEVTEEEAAPAEEEAEEAVEKQKITVWALTQDPEVKEYMETKYQEKFPNLEVEYSWYASEDFKNQVRIAVEAGNPPDVFAPNAGSLFWEYVDKGALLDIKKYVDEKNLWERAGMDFFNNFTRDDKLYGMPSSGLTVWMNLYVNRDILKNSGITEDPKTLDDLVKACKAIKESGYQPIAFGNKDGWPAILLMGDYFLNFGTFDMIEKVNSGEIKWQDSEPLVKSLESIVALAQSGSFMDGFNMSDHVTAIQTFASGKSAFLYNGSWWSQNLDVTVAEIPFDLDVIWLPRASSDGEIKGVQMSSDMPYVISSKSKNPDAAADWLDFISTKEYQKLYCENWEIFSIYPGLNSELNIDPVFVKDPIVKQFDYPITGVFFDWAFPISVVTVMKAQIQLAMDGRITVKEAVAEIQKATDEELK